MDVFETGKISDYRLGLLAKTMKAFRLLIEVYDPVGYRICATSAMREAENRQAVLDTIHRETGFDIEVIDGREEARLISQCNNIPLKPDIRYQLYIDVGGGSTELSLFEQKEFVASSSMNIGTIRLLNDKVTEETWEEMKQWIMTHVSGKKKMICIGSGGNINKLVKLFGHAQESSISRKRLKSAHQLLESMPMDARAEQFGMRQDRADVIVPAAAIFLRIMKWGNIGKVIAPRFGLADGLAIAQYIDHHKKP
jgi:exopolyphosphatase/guanosine-5'-triphosphate,3'-diphosphate pyrophosphatase